MPNNNITPFTQEDAKTVIDFIDVLAKRGSFAGSELTTVGNIRSRFDQLATIAPDLASLSRTTASDEVVEKPASRKTAK